MIVRLGTLLRSARSCSARHTIAKRKINIVIIGHVQVEPSRFIQTFLPTEHDPISTIVIDHTRLIKYKVRKPTKLVQTRTSRHSSHMAMMKLEYG